MAHGLGDGVTTLYDKYGNAIEVVLQPNGTYALAVEDVKARMALEEILRALKGPQNDNPWAFVSPWP